jgi:hypothetical protein
LNDCYCIYRKENEILCQGLKIFNFPSCFSIGLGKDFYAAIALEIYLDFVTQVQIIDYHD